MKEQIQTAAIKLRVRVKGGGVCDIYKNRGFFDILT
jgi:hypothetical protein